MLLGATGTGKSATTAWLIEAVQRPTLVLAHNKTLAAQLASEFRELFPNNAVEYFVSYYDYYQPEAYVPQTDTFIEKDSSVNAEVERLRHSTTNALLSRRDTIVVSTVSCIYGLGKPEEYYEAMVPLVVGDVLNRDVLLRRFVDMQYQRNDIEFVRGNFRVRGDTVEIIPMYEELAIRIEFFGDEIEALYSPPPGDRRRHQAGGERVCLPRLTLRCQPRGDEPGNGRDYRGARWQALRAQTPDEARRRAAAAHAHNLRPGDDGADRILLRYRELFAAHRWSTARRGAALFA